MSELSRREFVSNTAIAGASLILGAAMLTDDESRAAPATTTGAANKPVELHWLEGTPKMSGGATWGVAWPRGAVNANQTFGVAAASGESIAVQSWPLATWPDGSLKWTAHAIGAMQGLVEKLV